MQKIDELFQNFKEQVDQICQHNEGVENLHFNAKLKNGTSFNFNYSSELYRKSMEKKEPYQPLSVFNSIVDIIGAAITLFFVFVSFTNLPIAILFLCLLACFIFSCLNHLFDINVHRPHIIFTNLGEACKVVALSCLNYAVASLYQYQISVVLISTLIIGALALLFLSMQTRMAQKASLAMCILLPFVCLFAKANTLSVSTSILYALWSAGNLILGQKTKASSNTIFAIMATVMTAFLFGLL
ncbi:MAG: hypothetical protein WCR02_01140 [Sphaerochaetaceae bacterium]